MKMILIILCLSGMLYANKSERLFWNEVKESNDIELLKLYKEEYPNGVYEKLADIKIKRLIQDNQTSIESDPNAIPYWIKGTKEYRFYGVGKANKHVKGKHYQENLARSRARRDLQKLLDKGDLTEKEMYDYNSLIETKMYVDKRDRVYILLFIDNINLY